MSKLHLNLSRDKEYKLHVFMQAFPSSRQSQTRDKRLFRLKPMVAIEIRNIDSYRKVAVYEKL
ncbi:uncharacterized protein ACLA_016400 [Aspergillus clavatus NRRL 1]|uniref:Uncharacterized protein n=1 Tax=Aspergillus clavatus (strain ATCC 1007 / CBS 513.65 / DSM 816 / NCTC 3887 / NRRL 1 / QM 1276 / 107) TaxID=344612 RepID=A1CBS6_ASPCL|nr:uncharacterized protein ACLA_016400 [Aspergillus clavatus NRRL 1]EAW13194.1 hypothetical protein ACLA_016400 [Aspergillus clavatus NRRL 1]